MLGKLVSKKFISEYLGTNKYFKLKSGLCTHNKLIIFLLHLSPFSSPVIVFLAGMMKVNLKIVLLYSFFGLFVKYLIISLIYFLRFV